MTDLVPGQEYLMTMRVRAHESPPEQVLVSLVGGHETVLSIPAHLASFTAAPRPLPEWRVGRIVAAGEDQTWYVGVTRKSRVSTFYSNRYWVKLTKYQRFLADQSIPTYGDGNLPLPVTPIGQLDQVRQS